jgi:penicillin-binding protein 1A
MARPLRVQEMGNVIDNLSGRLSLLARAHRRLFLATVIAISVLLWTAAGFGAWFIHDILTDLPDKTALKSIGTMAQSTTLVDVKGRHAFTIFREQRIDVPLERISPHLVHAIVAIEDQRFYEHGGVDIVRVAGAALSNLRAGRAAQGGSTLTQQLARQSFLSPDKTIRRKLKEVVLAARLEREYTKDQLLEMYLNKVYFGDGLYGVEAASLGYFGKHAADISVGEAALLAGLVKSPSSYAPTVSPSRALSRRKVVLQAMRDSHAIDAATYNDAMSRPVVLNDALRREEAYGQYFKEEVRQQLVEKFGWERVYQGGLKVYTTIDLDLQRRAEEEVARSISQIEQRKAKQGRTVDSDASDPLQAALVALDPATGEVRAMVGGRDFDQSHFNRAVQAKRQPGSAFKPFVYAAALEQGFTPATLLTDLDDPVMTVQGAWVPEDEHLDSPSITMRAALRTSSNRAAVRMLQEVGIPTAVRYAKQLGVGDVPSVPSLALGSGEVTLLSMTAAYGAFANKGMVTTPLLILRVESTDGETLYTATPHLERGVSESTAFLMTSMMADVINAGTAWQARQLGFTLPAAGKTGTTNDYKDAWFVGFTPHLVTGVWVGYDQPRTIVRGGYAAELAVPLWARFMASATAHDQPDWFSAPANVTSATICRLSGKLAVDGCAHAEVVDRQGNLTIKSQVYTEYFARGTEPVEYCPLHGLESASSPIATTGSPQAEPGHQAIGEPPATVKGSEDGTAPKVDDSRPSAEPASPAPEKRRGFWSRVFGRGDNDKREKKNKYDKGD